VMEKCTYCVQRISKTKIAKRIVGEDVKDGDIVTACQQACPTQAIVFGNLREKDAHVVTLQKNPRAYEVLGELNTRPRTKYLAKLRNPPELATAGGKADGKEEHTVANQTDSVG
jgi:Fe-S-cluster-containing dehydrogenase component